MIGKDSLVVVFLSTNKQDHITNYLTEQGIHFVNGKEANGPIDLQGKRYLIRYGSRQHTQNNQNLIETLNRSAAIKLFANKFEGRKVMQAIGTSNFVNAGWSTGWFYGDEYILNDGWDAAKMNNRDLLVRPQKHTRGNNINIVQGRPNVIAIMERFRRQRKKSYVQEAYKKKREFRIYFMGPGILAVFEKVPNDKNEFYWGGDNAEWTYLADEQIPQAFYTVAADAAERTPIDFGAIDIIETNKHGDLKYVFLELNTCFEAQGPYMAEKFTLAARKMLDDPAAWRNAHYKKFIRLKPLREAAKKVD